jgi:hypothetical protein
MSSVTSANNAGVSDLLQALSSTASGTLSSVLSSSSVQSALQKASPGDLVALSQQAVESQVAAGLFSGSNTSQTTTTDPATLLLQAVNSSITGTSTSGTSTTGTSTTASTTSGSTTTSASASLQQVEDLFGANSTTGQTTGLSFLG